MSRLTTLLSRRCCGGPTLVLTTLSTLLGVLFIALAATLPGLVFIATGMGALGLCLLLGRKRCPALPRGMGVQPNG